MKVTRHEFAYGLDCDQATEEITRLRQLEQAGTRYAELFGTPEQTARTLNKLLPDSMHCEYCMFQDYCKDGDGYCLIGDYDALLEWLRGDEQ